MIILGVDPGNGNYGYGVIESDGHIFDDGPPYGAVTTPCRLATAAPLVAHLRGTCPLLIAQHQPTDAVVKNYFSVKNVRTALSVGQARVSL